MDLEQAYDKIYRYAYFKLHDQTVAEDITQETFLRYLNSGNHRGGFEMAYLYTITRNLCIDEFRKVKWDPIPESSEGNPAHDPTESMVEMIAVKDALSKLGQTDREILLLRFANEEPVGTISKLYHCSRFAVYRQIKKAKEELKRQLGGEEHEP